MTKKLKLTETELTRLIKRVISEQGEDSECGGTCTIKGPSTTGRGYDEYQGYCKPVPKGGCECDFSKWNITVSGMKCAKKK
jgi:hypothetical protein